MCFEGSRLIIGAAFQHHYEVQTHHWLRRDLLWGRGGTRRTHTTGRKQALISVWIASAHEGNIHLKASFFLARVQVCVGWRSDAHTHTHTSCLPSETHINCRDCNYRHPHNVVVPLRCVRYCLPGCHMTTAVPRHGNCSVHRFLPRLPSPSIPTSEYL